MRPNVRIQIWFWLTLAAWAAGSRPAAAQYHPVPGRDAEFVNYQIEPLPPIDPPEPQGIFPLPEFDSEYVPSPSDLPPGAAKAEEVAPIPEELADEADGDASEEATEIEASTVIDERAAMFELWRMWEVGFELGINGSVGNSDTHTWRSAIRTKRETQWSKLTADFDYKHSLQESTVTADRLFFEWRAELPFQDSPWSAYLHGTIEFDEFKAFDTRVTDDGGLGFQWFKSDRGSFITRAGAGASREFGGPEDKYVPEGVLGAVFERKLSRRQKLNFSSEYFFDWSSWSENRLNTKANWEVILDEEAHLSLRVGIINRYDSTPNGSKPNDLDYSTVLLWTF